METDLTPEQMEDVVRNHVLALMEHFESVQVLASVSSSIGTQNVFLGAGNWFARQGMAHHFITQEKARTEAHEISKALPS